MTEGERREPPVDPATLARGEDEDGPTFEEPWQARAFGICVALYDDGAGFEWSAFQERLIEEVRRGDPTASDAEALEGVYYEQWLAALERLLVEDGAVEPGELEARATEFAAGERTAEEFVAGEREH
jgi:nitrile hydratase accessory protein